jgi:hypothetical protein
LVIAAPVAGALLAIPGSKSFVDLLGDCLQLTLLELVMWMPRQRSAERMSAA